MNGADMNICIGNIDVKNFLMLTSPISRFHDAKNLNCLLNSLLGQTSSRLITEVKDLSLGPLCKYFGIFHLFINFFYFALVSIKYVVASTLPNPP